MMLFTRKTLRWKRRARSLAVLFILLFLSEIITPTAVWALTGGPTQPEFQSFQQVGQTDMVDLFTGDFKYNIPLFEIDGYPINLNYNAGINMDQEASWVGLGWNLTPGMITRTVRGLPDDFNGEKIKENFRMKEEKEYTLSNSTTLELIGKELSESGESGGGASTGGESPEGTEGSESVLKAKLDVTRGITVGHNTRTGFFIGPIAAISAGVSSQEFEAMLGAGISYNPSSGLNLVPSFSMVASHIQPGQSIQSQATNLSLTTNSRNGLQNLSASFQSLSQTSGKLIGRPSVSGMPLSASIPLNEYTYFPYSKPIVSRAYTALDIKVGIDVTVADGNIHVKGTEDRSFIHQNDTAVEHKAYGYMYLENRSSEDLMDFNRDSDAGVFYPGQKHLPPSSLTPDLYSVNAQGISGTIRPYRMETGTYNEPSYLMNTNFSQDIGTDYAVGNTFKVGASITGLNKHHGGGPWKNVDDHFKGFAAPPENTLEQNLVFRYANEMMPAPDDFLAQINPGRAESMKLKSTQATHSSLYPQRLQYDSADVYQRLVQQKNIRVLSGVQAAQYGVEKYIHDQANTGPAYSIENSRVGDQISEISTTDRSGNRYVFGIPVKTLKHKEVMFNASGRTVTGSQVKYLEEDTDDNTRGVDHYYYSKELPSYTNSYLLTHWLGADYIDIKSDGVTDDDYGQAVRFHWFKAVSKYGWRSPVGPGQAHHVHGSMISAQDDRGTYNYGEKDIWYPHSIESKDLIAYFYTSPRKDAFGAANEYGVIDSTNTENRQHKLDRIAIVTKASAEELLANGTVPDTLKIIEFNYDYSLCQGAPNATSGKLTLKSVMVRHGNSKKGKLSPYLFDYSDFNPDYDPIKTDRWGNYKENNPNNLPYYVYPYVNPETPETTQNTWASAWNLTDVTLPSGAKIKVTYESDEYTYVQDKLAQQMYHVVGIGGGPICSDNDKLYKNSINSSLDYDHLYVDNPRPDVINSEESLDQLFRGLRDSRMYFNLDVLLPNKLGESEEGLNHERIRGYAKVLDYGFCQNGLDPDLQTLWIKVDAVDFNERGKEINPFLKAAFDFIYLKHQRLIFGSLNPNDGGFEQFAKNIWAFKDDIISFLAGPYKTMMLKKLARRFSTNTSMVRLNHPTGRKKGGGHRVSRITISDQWAELTGSSSEYSTTYGQVYSYNNEDGTTSGVAQYEPVSGNDEIPHKYPEYYKIGKVKSKKAKPSVFQEGPFGESFFPQPIVGYERVRVDDIHAATKKTTGTYTVHEYYSAKDFPFKTKHTALETADYNKKPIWAFFGYGTTKRFTATAQGYSFTYNDMHGKKHKESVYMEQPGFSKERIRKTEFVYQFTEDGKALDNTVKCIDRYGNYTDREFGVEAEVHVDAFENYEHSETVVSQANNSSFNVFAPMTILPIWFLQSHLKQEYRSVVTTELFWQQAILKKVIETNRDFETTVVNEVWDAHTGEVLLTSHKTHHDRPTGREDVQYSMKYPAYWTPDNGRMGHAYRNEGYIGTVGDTFNFLTQSQYVALSPAEQSGLKTKIYRGLLDGLENNLYQSLRGNIVQGGVFAEGDVVHVEPNGEVIYAEEVLSHADVSAILALTGAGGSPPLNTGGGSSIPGAPGAQGGNGSSGGSIGGATYLPCGNVVITDPTMEACYQTMLSLTNAQTVNLSALPLLDTNHQAIYDYLASPEQSEWYSLWHSPQFEGLFEVLQEVLNNPALRNVLNDIYTDQAQRQAYYNLFQCNGIMECLESNAQNSTVLQAFEALMAAPMRLNLAAGMASYYNQHYVVSYLGGNTQNSTYSSSTGCHYDTSFANNEVMHKIVQAFNETEPCPLVMDLFSYEQFLTLTFNDLQSLPDSSSASCYSSEYSPLENPSGSGVMEFCMDVNPYLLFNLSVSCENYAQPTSTAGGGAVLQLDSLPAPWHNYHEPTYDELVLFMDSAGNIKNLAGKKIKIVRSGRRNLVGAFAAGLVTLNQNPIDNTNVATASVKEVLNASLVTFSDDWPSDFMPASATGQRFNPFLFGQRGVFRPDKMYATHGTRQYGAAINSRNDGVMQEYTPFWGFYSDTAATRYNQLVSNAGAEDSWLLTEDMLYYSGSGAQLQSVNALDIYSAMVAERSNRVTIEAGNASHKELLFESFEASGPNNGMASSNQLMESFLTEVKPFGTTVFNPLPNEVSDTVRFAEEAHTGEQSLVLRGQHSIAGNPEFAAKPEAIRWRIPLEGTGNTYDNPLYRIPGFVPVHSKEMIVSAWMQSVNTALESPSYQGASFDPNEAIGSLEIQYYNGTMLLGSTGLLFPEGTTIDGWRRLEQSFTIPAGADAIVVVVKGGDFGTLLDDLRMFPTTARMVSYVYSRRDHRLLALLDENNYATFYKYDQDGSLMKLERETENGRLTLKENLNNTAKSLQ